MKGRMMTHKPCEQGNIVDQVSIFMHFLPAQALSVTGSEDFISFWSGKGDRKGRDAEEVKVYECTFSCSNLAYNCVWISGGCAQNPLGPWQWVWFHLSRNNSTFAWLSPPLPQGSSAAWSPGDYSTRWSSTAMQSLHLYGHFFCKVTFLFHFFLCLLEKYSHIPFEVEESKYWIVSLRINVTSSQTNHFKAII